jgi:hypothetical protein
MRLQGDMTKMIPPVWRDWLGCCCFVFFLPTDNICNRFALWTPGAAVVRLLLAVQGDELRWITYANGRVASSRLTIGINKEADANEFYSADATIAQQATGAMSWAFVTALKKNPQQSYVQLLNSIRDELAQKYTQRPQLSCSHPLSQLPSQLIALLKSVSDQFLKTQIFPSSCNATWIPQRIKTSFRA